MKLGFVFPGQGAQYVGMGKELLDRYPVAKETFAAADEALGFSLTKLCLEGPESELKLTYYTQPALLTCSIAAYRVFISESDLRPDFVAGHSLGEYTALVAAGAISFEEAVTLVHWRGKWMDEAVPAGVGAMAAVLGMDANLLSTVCEESTHGLDSVELANINCPGQIVISGTKEAVERASVLAKERGAKRAIPLEVSGPFHSRLMKPAAEKLARALQDANLVDSRVPVICNVDAMPRTEQGALRDALERQLYSPVRWEDDVRSMIDLGATAFVEFGSGTVLSGLIRKIDKSVSMYHVENPGSLEETVQALSQA